MMPSILLALLLAACGAANGEQTPPETSTTDETAGPVEPGSPEPTIQTPQPTVPDLPAGDFEPLIGLELIAGGLAAPIALADPGDGSGRLLIADQVGLIYVRTPEGELSGEPFLDIRDRMLGIMPAYDERGLLGLALHPDYVQNGRFFVYYSAPLRPGAPAEWNHTSHISEFHVPQDDPNRADPGSERILLQIDQPQQNHNGGQIAFGPDGYLYIALGDGGGANDASLGHPEDWYDLNPGGNGQDIRENLLGSILRLDVDSGDPYGIPADNPFAGQDGLAEIYAYGLRNPFRFTFDAGGGHRMLAGDAGENLWEEVNVIERGGNYGWNVKEGTHCFDAANPTASLPECPSETTEGVPLIDPVIEYQNAKVPGGLGLVVIGGYVYRGSALPSFAGRYIFGDWSATGVQPGAAKLLVATPSEAGGLWPFEELRIAGDPDGSLNLYLLSFGQDAANELYVLASGSLGPSGDSGMVFKIVPPGAAER